MKISFYYDFNYFISNFWTYFRKLSVKQLSLMKSFAELEENTSGSIKGVEKKQSKH